MKINLRSFESFRDTMLTGSVTAAAERLKLSQPAVSRIISQLEADLGFALFYRDRGRLVPTPEGELLYKEVTLAFGGVERLSDLAHDIANFNSGQLRIVCPPGISEGVLPEIIAQFAAQYPNVRISIEPHGVDVAQTMVATRVADCGFAKLPLVRDDLRIASLSVSETMCVMKRTNPLADHEVITPKLMGAEKLIMLAYGKWERLVIDEAFTSIGLRPRVMIETRTVGSACALVSQGLGVTFVNELIGRHFMTPEICMRRFRPQVLHNYVFVTSALTPMGRLAEAFYAVALDYFAANKLQVFDT